MDPMDRYRIDAGGSMYYVTFSVVHWLPVFGTESACRIITDSLNCCHQHKGLRTNAHVVLPTHLHAVVFFEEFNPLALKDTLTGFREFTGRKLSDHCDKYMPPCVRKVLRQAAPDDRDSRLWQPSLHPEQIDNQPF